jgi:hypothetical protein
MDKEKMGESKRPKLAKRLVDDENEEPVQIVYEGFQRNILYYPSYFKF